METMTSNTPTTTSVISSKDLLTHWQAHRGLTRRVIEAFPEKELFEFSIGGMRPFAKIIMELLAIGAPGVKEIAEGTVQQLNEDLEQADTKEKILALWDEATATIDQYWAQIPDQRFQEKIMAFGQYEGTVQSTVLYYIDNEIHHRGQGYVYLRALGIEPPFFWQR
ncbi:DinB family protein [Rufibacter quisquiliarum]|uniref:Putative damage-inducible protein DinB n=1 Tax=Rufibacter quisquiliarum TaxID=1549639 RepID=A0A839GUC9_9BACT|nr:DinB family protein [Rufibacter quisquiliarum]MBA9078487.1 putative damage-inducible protein DinB [Rufibacter quisquiliarum]